MSRWLWLAVLFLLVLCKRPAGAKHATNSANKRGTPQNRCDPTFHLIPLRHYDYVAALEDDILLHVLTGTRFFVIKRMFYLPAVFHPQNVYFLFSRNLCKPTRTRKRLQYRHIGQ